MRIDGKQVKFIKGHRVKLKNRRVTMEEFTGNHFRLGWRGLKDRKKRIILSDSVVLGKEALEATCRLILGTLEDLPNEFIEGEEDVPKEI